MVSDLLNVTDLPLSCLELMTTSVFLDIFYLPLRTFELNGRYYKLGSSWKRDVTVSHTNGTKTRHERTCIM